MVVRQEHEVFFRQAQEDLQKFYRNSQLEYFPTAEHRAHAEFDAKSAGRPIRKHVDKVFRVRTGSLKGKEHVFFYETHIGTDHRGNRISKFVVNGKYDRPIGLYQYDELRGENVCIGIDSFETVHQYAFETKILDEMLENEEIDGNTAFIMVVPGGRQYAGFDFEFFRGGSFEDLDQFCRTGERPQPNSQPQLQQSKKQQKEQ